MTTATQPVSANGGASPPAKPSPVASLRQLLEKSKEQIAMALPRHLTPERMIRVAITAVQRTPALLDCTPMSIVSCVMQAAELGLELTGPLGQAYMIPRNNSKTRQKEANFQVGYRGLISLAFRSGQVGFFNAHEVRERDEFRFEYGTNQRLVHRPALKERGELVAFYGCFRLKDGSADFEVMSLEDVAAHRDRYAQGHNRGDSPWQTAFDEMAKKTVIRRLAKRAPISIELTRAAVIDEYAEAGVQGEALGFSGTGIAAPPDSGRHSLRAPHPEEAPQQHPADAPDPEPGEVAPSQEEMAAIDLAVDYEEQIGAAEDEEALRKTEAAIDQDAATLGQDRVELLGEALARKRGTLKGVKRGK